jgi:hypothetical protein
VVVTSDVPAYELMIGIATVSRGDEPGIDQWIKAFLRDVAKRCGAAMQPQLSV